MHVSNISIHALQAESDGKRVILSQPMIISIHALQAESDYRGYNVLIVSESISIHALQAESDYILHLCSPL